MQSYEIAFNLVAQERLDVALLVEWFGKQTFSDQEEILKKISLMVSQSHPTQEEILNGILESQMRPTFTPCVLFRKFPCRIAIKKCCELPESEYEKTLKLFVYVFKISDARRRHQCGEKCFHEWHNISESVGSEAVKSLL